MSVIALTAIVGLMLVFFFIVFFLNQTTSSSSSDRISLLPLQDDGSPTPATPSRRKP